MFVDPKTNEVYVADGYGNKRVIVFDADTGKYKRHWGALRQQAGRHQLGPYDPSMPPKPSSSATRCTAPSFRMTACCTFATASNDRIQVFKPDGTL